MRRVLAVRSLWHALRPVLKGLFAESLRRSPALASRLETLEGRQLLSVVNEPPFAGASTNDMAYDSQGNLHVAYYKADTGDLYYAKRSSSGEWLENTKVDGDGLAGGADVGGQLSLAICGNNPAIAYYDAVNGDLKYVALGAQGWTAPESADADNASLNIGASPSLVFNNATPIVSYANWTNKNLRVSRKIDGVWQRVYEKASTDDTGRFTSVAIGSNGRWCVASANKTTGTLVFTQSIDTQTVVETNVWQVASGDVITYVSLAIDSAGNPGISYCDNDSQAGYLRFVQATGGTWGQPQSLDSSSTNEQYTNLFFDGTSPIIAYGGRGTGSVEQAKLATKSGSVWTLSTMLSGYGLISAALASDGTVTFTNLRTGDSGLHVDDYQNGLLAPTDLTTQANANTVRIDLSWTDNSSNETGFIIERSTDGVNFTVINDQVPANATTYSDWGSGTQQVTFTNYAGQLETVTAYNQLNPSSSYTYRVRAKGTNGNSTASTTQQGAMPSSFHLFDDMTYTGQPKAEMRYLGIEGIYETSNGFLVNGSYSEAATRALARRVNALNQILVLDIETMRIDNRIPEREGATEEEKAQEQAAANAEVDATLRQLAQLICWAKAECPNLKVGLYGNLPIRDWNTTTMPREREPYRTDWVNAVNAWKAANDYAAGTQVTVQATTGGPWITKSLIQWVDCLFPSLYTMAYNRYDGLNNWRLYAEANIAEARRIAGGKPVYPYLWMEYHQNAGAALLGQNLSDAEWQLQLSTVRELADGAVLWGGWTKTWNDQASWWQITADFIDEPRQAPSTPTGVQFNSVGAIISWNDTSNEDGYIIERTTDGTNYTQIAVIPENTTEWADPDLRGQPYGVGNRGYRVWAFNAAGRSANPALIPVTSVSRNAFVQTRATLADTFVLPTGSDVRWSDYCVVSTGPIGAGGYLQYNNVVFGATGANQITACVSVADGVTANPIEVFIDDPNNTDPIAVLEPTNTYGQQVLYTQALSSLVTGTHNVYLKAEGPGQGKLYWFQFGNN
ncbi:MAG: carbohydrate-binding protein [Bacillota bacterium]